METGHGRPSTFGTGVILKAGDRLKSVPGVRMEFIMTRCSSVFLVVLALGMPAVHAQSEVPEVETPALAENVAGIRQALDRLVELLETVQRNQRVDLLLKRIELRERRLAPLQKRLAAAQGDVEGSQAERVRMRAMKEQQERQIDESARAGSETDDIARLMLQEIEQVEAAMEARLEDAEARVRRFEDELAEGREEVEILDEILLELLDSD